MTIYLQKFILIMVRVTTFIVVCPGFSYKGLSNIFKVALSIAISMFIHSIIPDVFLTNSMYGLLFLSIREVLLGLSMGYITKLVFTAIEIAGQTVDFQIGFSMAAMFDPSTGINASHYGRIYYWLSIAVFFILNMHHMMIEAIIYSFDIIPIGELVFSGNGVEGVIKLFISSFELAVNLAAPLVIVALITDVVLGIISRTVPQINVLMLGMPIKALISFFITLIMLSWLVSRVGHIISLTPEYLDGYLKLFVGE